jgi:hypothetical protein
LYDVVQLNLPEVGAVGSFLIVGYAWPEDGGIDLTLVPHLASDYAWAPASMERLVEDVPRPNWDYPAPGLSGFTRAVELLTYGDGQVQRFITGLWDEPDWAIISHYEFQIQEEAEPWRTTQAAETSWKFESSPDKTYLIRVRVVGLNGKKGPWTSAITTGPVE